MNLLKKIHSKTWVLLARLFRLHSKFFDIMYDELYAIYHGFLLTKDMSIINVVCYSLHCINIIKGTSLKYHVYAVLIQDIRDLIEQGNVSVIHILREGNQCADYMLNLVLHQNLSPFVMTLIRQVFLSCKVMQLEPSV